MSISVMPDGANGDRTASFHSLRKNPDKT